MTSVADDYEENDVGGFACDKDAVVGGTITSAVYDGSSVKIMQVTVADALQKFSALTVVNQHDDDTNGQVPVIRGTSATGWLWGFHTQARMYYIAPNTTTVVEWSTSTGYLFHNGDWGVRDLAVDTQGYTWATLDYVNTTSTNRTVRPASKRRKI